MSLLNTLLQQCKYPNGPLGSFLLHTMNIAHINLVKWGLSKIEIPAVVCILDIGCGGGRAIQMLLNQYNQAKVYGIDPSNTAIQATIKRNKSAIAANRTVIKNAVVEDIPFEDQSFDLVTAFQTHYFWPNLKNGFAEVKRVLKPNGQFLLVSEIYKINYHMTAYKTSDELKALAQEIGFESKSFTTNKYICLVCVNPPPPIFT